MPKGHEKGILLTRYHDILFLFTFPKYHDFSCFYHWTCLYCKYCDIFENNMIFVVMFRTLFNFTLYKLQPSFFEHFV